MKTPEQVLFQFWGYESFRPLQREIIESVLKANDTLALLPTGGGKSLCFQIPAILNDGICLVITPLVALMKDQVDNLKKRGIKAISIHSGLTQYEIDIQLDNAIYGDYKFLYISPERLRSDLTRARLSKMNINYLAIDEAHCISQWGYDFRPSYLQIPDVYELLGRPPIIALTATATPKVSIDIMEKLKFNSNNLFKSRFLRENLKFSVRECEDKYGVLLKLLVELKGSGIIYARERKRVEEISTFINLNGYYSDAYHAGFSSKERADKQVRWLKDEVSIMTSTNAFGMGIDKQDVRFVIHFDIPESLEAYYQEAGRAGRDGEDSQAVLLWNLSDKKRVEQIIKTSFPDIEYLESVYQKVFVYFQIAYGAGEGEIRKFDLIDFSKSMSLHAVSAYHAIKHIEQEGYWQLTEELDNPSRIKFLVTRDELYKVQLQNPSLDGFIKSILRLYTSLFSGYVTIDEEFIGRKTRNSKAAIESSLSILSSMKIISYYKSSVSPLLIFNQERLNPSNFFISPEGYVNRRDNYKKRVNSVFEYLENNNKCRSQFLLEYFGESDSPRCKVCDVCIRDDDYSSGSYLNKRNIVKKILLNSKESVDSIAIKTKINREDLFQILRDLIDSGDISEKDFNL